jgi:anaerobic dimethyl sulfoxide reductase subunit B (iron-sulfur subunit)
MNDEMKKQYFFYINSDRCVQCHACAVACKSWNSLEPGIQWRRILDVWDGQFPEVTNQTISYSCMHCAKPVCVDACPEHAIYKRVEDGIVIVDPAKCAGCRTCATVCPFHIPQHGKSGAMQKCNFCLERLEQGKQPSCVATCPGEALKFGAMEELTDISLAKSVEKLSASTDPSFLISGRFTGAVFLSLLNSSEKS